MNECDIFMAALEKVSLQERTAFLDQACADNPNLRRRIETLLESHGQAGSLLEHPPLGAATVNRAQGSTDGAADGRGPPATALEAISLDFLAPADDPQALGRLGSYAVTQTIGSGGMGIVLKAHDSKLNRVVAVKVLAPQLATSAIARQRFLREAKAAAAVRDEHVVTIFAVDDESGLPYVVMELIAGMSLQERLDRDGALKLNEILRIGIQTARGLAAAHAHGLIHRDIKPANILLENGVERVKLTDFGLARVADDASLTQSGVIAGTPQYMSPEQARGEALDYRTDLFSLGSVLYAMCTGRAPFRAANSMSALKRVCEDAPSPIREANSEIPDWLNTLIDKLHAKNREDRYQSAAEVADLLGQRLAQLQHSLPLPPLATPKPATVRPPRGAGAYGPLRRRSCYFLQLRSAWLRERA